jgi:hypothetical protein
MEKASSSWHHQASFDRESETLQPSISNCQFLSTVKEGIYFDLREDETIPVAVLLDERDEGSNLVDLLSLSYHVSDGKRRVLLVRRKADHHGNVT